MLCNSWVVVDRETGKPVMETWSAEVAAAVNTRRYDVMSAYAWLVEVNRRIKAGLM